MTTATVHCYIVREDQILGGEPIIKGTRTPVRAIVEMWRIGMAPEAIPFHLPHLTVAQVFCQWTSECSLTIARKTRNGH